MTIPEDVREAMRQALEFCAGDYCMTGDRYEHFDAALAWLDAQPEVPESEPMQMPDEVRGWIESAAKVASDSARYYDADSSSSDAVLAWLDAQPAPSERWEPVEDGCHGNIRQRAGSLYLDMGIENDEYMILLPKGYAFCRRVEVTE